jgi:hypothetical protein
MKSVRLRISTFRPLPFDTPAGKLLAKDGDGLDLYDRGMGRGAPWAVELAKAWAATAVWPTSLLKLSFRDVLKILLGDEQLQVARSLLQAINGTERERVLRAEEARASLEAIGRISSSSTTVIAALCDLLGVEDESGHRD